MSPAPTAHRPEAHRGHRAAWLRAAVLGADDGIVSTASLMVGVAAAHASGSAVLTAGLAGLSAGALAMAAGEYVSVASQRDSEQADLARESRELAAAPVEELAELTELYVRRGVAADVARLVAEQLSAHDPLSAHARDELGLSAERAAKPLQAALASATAFAVGAVFPILTLLVSPSSIRIALIVAVALSGLCVLGWLGAVAGGADWRRPVSRVAIGGTLAMAITMAVGFLTHTAGG